MPHGLSDSWHGHQSRESSSWDLFYVIYWLKKCGIMPGSCFASELISHDKDLHCDFACLLLVQHASPLHIWQIIESAVMVKHEFVCDSLPVKLIGKNATLMCWYIEFCVDHLLLVTLRQPVMHYEVPSQPICMDGNHRPTRKNDFLKSMWANMQMEEK